MDFRVKTHRLRELAAVPPTEETRREVVSALASKFEGIQAVAAEVLGAWRDDKSKRALREWLMGMLDREHAWAIRSVAMRELAPLLSREDTEWVLNLYFGAANHLLQHELLRLAAALPDKPGKALVSEKARDSNPTVRHAALKILVRSGWGEPLELLRPFAADLDPTVRKLLRAWGAA